MPSAVAKAKASIRPKLKVLEPKRPIANMSSDEFKKMAKKYGCITGTECHEYELSKDCYSFGSLGLDCAIGRVQLCDRCIPHERHQFGKCKDKRCGWGGAPARSIIEIFGDTGVYKSGTLEHLILDCQRKGKIPWILYTEQPELSRMRRMGIDTDFIGIINAYEPSKWKDKDFDERELLAEQGLAQLVELSEDPRTGLIAIDSVKGLTGAMGFYEKGDQHKQKMRDFAQSEMAVRAKLMEKFFDQVKLRCVEAVIAFTNQKSDQILKNYVTGQALKPQTSGGRRKEFEALIRIEVMSSALEDDEHEIIKGYKPMIGLKITYKVSKNRYSNFTGNRRIHVDFLFGRKIRKPDGTTKHVGDRFDRSEEVRLYGTYLGIIERNGNHYSFPDFPEVESINGRTNVISFLNKNGAIREHLARQILSMSDDIFANKRKGKKKKQRVTVKSVLERDLDQEDDDDAVAA